MNGPPEHPGVDITFRIYDQEVGGALKWTEKQTVLLTKGFYAVFLGSQEPFPPGLFDGNARWLELQIEGDSAPLKPRQQIASVAYALLAGAATNLTGPGAAAANLGYTPVQQGTGSRQGSNAVKLGWTGSRFALTVDNSDVGDVMTMPPGGTISRPQLPDVGQQVSGSSGTFTTSRETEIASQYLRVTAAKATTLTDTTARTTIAIPVSLTHLDVVAAGTYTIGSNCAPSATQGLFAPHSSRSSFSLR